MIVYPILERGRDELLSKEITGGVKYKGESSQ